MLENPPPLVIQGTGDNCICGSCAWLQNTLLSNAKHYIS